MLVLPENFVCKQYTLRLDSATSVPCSALFMTFVHLSSDESESKRFISLFRSSVSPQPLGNKNQRTVGKINQQLYLIAPHQLLLSRLLAPFTRLSPDKEWRMDSFIRPFCHALRVNIETDTRVELSAAGDENYLESFADPVQR